MPSGKMNNFYSEITDLMGYGHLTSNWSLQAQVPVCGWLMAIP